MSIIQLLCIDVIYDDSLTNFIHTIQLPQEVKTHDAEIYHCQSRAVQLRIRLRQASQVELIEFLQSCLINRGWHGGYLGTVLFSIILHVVLSH